MNLDVLEFSVQVPPARCWRIVLPAKDFRLRWSEPNLSPLYDRRNTTPGVESLLKQAQIDAYVAGLSPVLPETFLSGDQISLHFSAHSRESKSYGFQVNRAVFDSMLMASAQRAGASFLQPGRPTEVHAEPAGWRVRIRFQSGSSSWIRTETPLRCHRPLTISRPPSSAWSS